MSQTHELRYTSTALDLLSQINDTEGKVEKKIKQLTSHPESRGDPLSGPLNGLHSTKAGQYRIVYRVTEKVVFVYAVGLRKEGDRDDIYNVVQRLYGLEP